MRLRLSDAAAADIAESWAWYTERSPAAATRFLDAVALALRTIEMFPRGAPLVDERAHRFQLHRFPHGVYYIVEGDEFVVFACVHGRRSGDVWRNRERG